MKRSFTVPSHIFSKPGWSRIPPLEKGFLLALFGECDGYGILPVIKAGRVSELDQLGWDAVMEILFELNKKGLIHIYEVDGEEYLRIDDYDSHLSSVQVNRRSTLWPHHVDNLLTEGQQLVNMQTLNAARNSIKTPKKKGKTVQKEESVAISLFTNDNIDLPNGVTGKDCKERAKKWNSDENFNTFWKSYYSTAKSFGSSAGSKKEAYTVWRQVDASLGTIMEGLVKWAKSKDWVDGRIRHACRWLKAEMWNDDPVPCNPEGNKEHYKPSASSAVLFKEDDVPF